MKTGRILLILLLGYVALDLALPMMPGAFVFDLTQSVESARSGRTPLDSMTPPVPARRLPVVVPDSRRADLLRRGSVLVRAVNMSSLAASRRCLTSCDAPQPAEEPA